MMDKNVACRLFCVILFLFSGLYLSAQGGRNSLLFNSGWSFHKGDVLHGEAVDSVFADWRPVDLPHDWSIEGPFSQDWASGTAFLPAGIGWYRKGFTVTPADLKKKVFIYFDGVSNNSEVWINGHALGKRPNGFVSFQYELTPYLISNRKNLLAVRVDHSRFADSRWYIGSGIYRNVYLIKTNPLHIGLWGVGFTTPVVNAGHAEARVAVDVENNTAEHTAVTVDCRLADGRGRIVAQNSKTLELASGDSVSTRLGLSIANPALWSVDHPRLYTLRVRVSAGGKGVDAWQEKVGMRSIRFSADSGFFLNGKNMKLKGLCIHDDAGVLGVAVPKAVWRRRLEILKAGGCNSLRFSHNPHADYMYTLCDELGFLVMDESFDEWEYGKNKWIKGWNAGTPGNDGYHDHFAEWSAKDLGDMIRRDRNHPSVILWSIGNEIDYPNDPYTDSVLDTGRNPQIYGKGFVPGHPPASQLGDISKRLVAVVRELDTTRPVTAALAGVVMSNKTSFPENLDIVGYNYQEYRYADDHKTYPNRVIYGSENSAQLSAWNAVDSNVFIAGQYLWTGIDYLGEARKWPQHASGAGIVDMAGFPKPAYYFRQSLWSDKPMVAIGVTTMTEKQSDEGQNRLREALPTWNFDANAKLRVSCFTNCSEAELFINGHSQGKKQLSQFPSRVIHWDVDYQPGEVMVKGFAGNGKDVSTIIKTAGEAAAISARIIDDPSHLKQIEITITDKNGVPVANAENEIIVRVEGPAKLRGLESGSLTDMEPVGSNSTKAVHGKLLAYVQLNGKPGIARVNIQSQGLKTIALVIK